MRPALPWILALVGSVLINGVLVGYLVHRTADGPDWSVRSGHAEARPERGGPPGRSGFDLRGFVDALPESARREARERLRTNFRDMRGIARDGMLARQDLDALLVAEEFDAVAVADAMDRMRASQRAVEAQIEAVVLEVVAGLDAETRAAALQAGRDRMARRGPPHAGPPHGRPPHDRPPHDRPPHDRPPQDGPPPDRE